MTTAPDPAVPAEPAVPVQTVPSETVKPQVTTEVPPVTVITEEVPAEKKNKLVPILLILIVVSLLAVAAAIIFVFGSKDKDATDEPTPTPTVTESVTPSVTDSATPTPEVTETATPTAVEKMTLKFYVFDSVKDPDVMDCAAPTFVTRELPKSSTPLADAVNYLITTFKLTANEKTAGLRNEFENADYAEKLAAFKLKSATVNNLTATLTFEDPQAFTSGGSCRSGILAAQITQTAKQFPTVTSVKYLPENVLFQP